MNKFVRFFLLLVLIAVVGIVTLAIVEPNDVTVTRSITIKAAKEPVWEQIVNFKNWPNWYILGQRDSIVKITYDGTDGQMGSSYHWAGDEHITGEGEMRNDGVEGDNMKYTFSVIKPGSMLAEGTISASDTAGQTKVTWTFHKHFPFLSNAVLVIFNLDKYIGGDFEAALTNLKDYVEKNNVYKAPVAIKEVDYPGHLFAGIRKLIPMVELTKFFGESYGILGKELKGKINGAAAGLYYSMDTVTKTTDVMAVMPVSDSAVKLADAIYIYAAPAKAYMVVYKGGYSAINGAHRLMDKQLMASGKKASLKIEEYMVGPAQEADSSKWMTNIYYLLQ